MWGSKPLYIPACADDLLRALGSSSNLSKHMPLPPDPSGRENSRLAVSFSIFMQSMLFWNRKVASVKLPTDPEPCGSGTGYPVQTDVPSSLSKLSLGAAQVPLIAKPAQQTLTMHS